MRVLVVSDVAEEALYSPAVGQVAAGVEAVLSCGDLPFPYLEFILTMLGVPLLYVAGNHDRPTFTADGRVVTRPEGGTSIDGRAVRLRTSGDRTLLVAGLGGSMSYSGSPNQYTEGEMVRRAARLAPRLVLNRLRHGRALDILVTHAAPMGIHDGEDLCHRGFVALRRLICAARPRYAFHGHVHPSYGRDQSPVRIGETLVMSVWGHRVVDVEVAG